MKDSNAPTVPPKDRKLFLETQAAFARLAQELNASNTQRIATLVTLVVLESRLQRMPPGIILEEMSEQLMKGTN